MREGLPHGCAKISCFFVCFLSLADRSIIVDRRRNKGRNHKALRGSGGGYGTGRGAEAVAEITEIRHFMRRLYCIQDRAENKMSILEMIRALRSGDAAEVQAAAEAAADALEVMEERLAIMGEVLTAKEWEATETEARRRVETTHL